MESKKRGQITLFIILGITILLVIFLFIYLMEATTIFRPEKVVPPELEPLDEYVGGCINIVARKGINLLGANGGFIRFPDEIEADPFSSVNVNPLFSNIKNPMWHYNGNTKIPSEDYMKEDLAWYIDNNIDSCLQNLSSFRQQFEINELEPRSIVVELTDRGVDVILDYKLEIKSLSEEQVTIIEDFSTTVPIRLKTVYDLARDIMEEELTDKFVEVRAVDLLALDPDIPYTDIEFSCAPKIWYIEDVAKKIQDLLTVNLPLIRVDKTSYADVPEDQPYVANHYIWEVTEQSYPTTKVSLSYDPTWPMNLYINPNEGIYLKSTPQQGFDMLSFFCMNMWHFTYDMKFPVMVTITDEEGKNHERYTFSFAFQAGVNNNMPDKTNFGISTFDYEQKAKSDEFCRDVPKNILTVHTFENVSAGDYGDLYEEIDDVNLTYTCLRMTCPVGQTEWAFRGAVALATQEVPYCVNGILKGEKEGYEDAQIFLSAVEPEQTAELYLTPISSKKVEVVKHAVFGERVDFEEELDDDQTAIITLKRNGLKKTAMYPSIDDDELSELEFLGKWDYTYEIEIYVADDRTILGGYKGNWTVPWNELKGAKTIKFHVAEFPYSELPETQFGYIMGLGETSKKLPQPEFLG